jgi:hypothetical protein
MQIKTQSSTRLYTRSYRTLPLDRELSVKHCRELDEYPLIMSGWSKPDNGLNTDPLFLQA